MEEKLSKLKLSEKQINKLEQLKIDEDNKKIAEMKAYEEQVQHQEYEDKLKKGGSFIDMFKKLSKVPNPNEFDKKYIVYHNRTGQVWRFNSVKEQKDFHLELCFKKGKLHTGITLSK